LAEFAVELKIPILGDRFGFGEAVFLGARPPILAGEITGALPVTAVVIPVPTAGLTVSNAAPTQGGTVTLTYSSTNATLCSIDNGILPSTATCAGTTSTFVPPFVAPGPTSTTYTFTVTGVNGTVQSTKTVVVSAVSASGDDSIYSTGTAEGCSYPSGVTTDGPAALPIVCNYTPLSATVSNGTVRTVGYSGGVATCGTAAAGR